MTRSINGTTITSKRTVSSKKIPSVKPYIAKPGDRVKFGINFSICTCYWTVSSSEQSSTMRRIFLDRFHKGSLLESLVFKNLYDEKGNLCSEFTLTSEFINPSEKNMINAFKDGVKMKFEKSIPVETLRESIILIYKNY